MRVTNVVPLTIGGRRIKNGACPVRLCFGTVCGPCLVLCGMRLFESGFTGRCIVQTTIDCIVVLFLLSVVVVGCRVVSCGTICGTNGTSLVVSGSIRSTNTDSCHSDRG